MGKGRMEAFSDGVIVVGVGEPGAAPCQSGQTAVQLGPEPIEINASELVNRDENDQRRRRGRA